jgi:prepilin-type N-terminal cleavage/methylation domain-containing protein
MNRKQSSQKCLDSAGVTLVELIIVVAIISVIAGALVLSTGFIGKSRVNKAYNKLQSDYSTARNNTMSKATASDLILYQKDNYYYIQVGSEQGERLITTNQSMTFRVLAAGVESTGISFSQMAQMQGYENEVHFSFERSSGALKSFGDSGSYITGIYIGTKGLYITYETGKYSTEDMK